MTAIAPSESEQVQRGMSPVAYGSRFRKWCRSCIEGSISKTLHVPWTQAAGLARTLIAVSTLWSVVVDGTELMIRPTGTVGGAGQAVPGQDWFNLFRLADGPHFVWAQVAATIILLLTASGWRPRFTGVLHWWVMQSFVNSATILEGGDQLAANLALLFIPWCLMDDRKWHWTSENVTSTSRDIVRAEIGASSLWIMRVQMCIVYLHASVGKLGVTEWQNGTAGYYWFTHPMFGAPDWLSPIVTPVVQSAVGVIAITWGAILLELLLAAALFMSQTHRRRLLVPALLFHFLIAIVHGLGTFSFAMAGALILYLYPTILERELDPQGRIGPMPRGAP